MVLGEHEGSHCEKQEAVLSNADRRRKCSRFSYPVSSRSQCPQVIFSHGYLVAMTHQDLVAWEFPPSALVFDAQPGSLFEDVQSWIINLPPASASPAPFAVTPVPFPESPDTAGSAPLSSDPQPLLILPSSWHLSHPHRDDLSVLEFDVLYDLATMDFSLTDGILHGVRYRLRYIGREEEARLGKPFAMDVVSKFRFPELEVDISEGQNQAPGYFVVGIPPPRGHKKEYSVSSRFHACCVYEPEGLEKGVDVHVGEFRDVRLSLLYRGSQLNIASCVSGLSMYLQRSRIATERIYVVDFP